MKGPGLSKVYRFGGDGGNRTPVRAPSARGLYVRSWPISTGEPDQRGLPAVCVPAFSHRVGTRFLDEQPANRRLYLSRRHSEARRQVTPPSAPGGSCQSWQLRVDPVFTVESHHRHAPSNLLIPVETKSSPRVQVTTTHAGEAQAHRFRPATQCTPKTNATNASTHHSDVDDQGSWMMSSVPNGKL